MTDYYPLIARAVAGLDPSAPGESRRALYERARAALTAQLRSVQPPVSESEIVRERLQLEEAVRKVESEAARRARDVSRAGGAARGGDTFPNANARPGEPAPSPSSSEPLTSQPSRPRPPTSSTFRTRDELAADRQAAQAKQEMEAAQATADEKRREEQRRLERAQREEQEAARIQKEERHQVVRAQLAKVASPEPSIDQDGRLDAGPNAVYDEPKGSDDLATLPIRQRVIINTILSDLPGNSPKYLKTALESYGDELKVRGAQPILGLLKDVFDIIEAAVDDPRAHWLEPGLQRAFEKLAEHHHSLVKHFPLDPEREELYARTLVREDEATGSSFSEPFKEVARAAQDANKAGLTTDDFFKVVDKMTEFAKIISTIPPSYPPSSWSKNHPEVSSEIIAVKPEDRIGPIDQPISATKRILLSALGFFERVLNLLSSAVSLRATPEGQALLTVVREAISALWKFIRPD
jgi:hypothetical protein